MSLFWLILKQQWTIKISSPLFLFFAWRPSWLEIWITGHNFGRGPSNDHSTKVWFKLAQWLQMSWLKCEKLTDVWTDDGRSVVTIVHLTQTVTMNVKCILLWHLFPLLTSTLKNKLKFPTRIVIIHESHSLYNVLTRVTLFSSFFKLINGHNRGTIKWITKF